MDALKFPHTLDLAPRGLMPNSEHRAQAAKQRGPPGPEDVATDSEAAVTDERATANKANARGVVARARADMSVRPNAGFRRRNIAKVAATAKPPEGRPAPSTATEIKQRCGVLGGFLEEIGFARSMAASGAMARHTAVLLRECHRAGVLEGVANNSTSAATALANLVHLCAHPPLLNGHREGDDPAPLASALPAACDASPYIQGGVNHPLLAHLGDLACTGGLVSKLGSEDHAAVGAGYAHGGVVATAREGKREREHDVDVEEALERRAPVAGEPGGVVRRASSTAPSMDS